MELCREDFLGQMLHEMNARKMIKKEEFDLIEIFHFYKKVDFRQQVDRFLELPLKFILYLKHQRIFDYFFEKQNNCLRMKQKFSEMTFNILTLYFEKELNKHKRVKITNIQELEGDDLLGVITNLEKQFNKIHLTIHQIDYPRKQISVKIITK